MIEKVLVPGVSSYTVSAQEIVMTKNDLLSFNFERYSFDTQNKKIEIPEKPIISVSEERSYLLNLNIVAWFLKDSEGSISVPALRIVPDDPLEENIISFCVNELTVLRYSRTDRYLCHYSKFNDPEGSNRGFGKSKTAHDIHWQFALERLLELPVLHEAIADRLFNCTADELKPKHYKRILSYQVEDKSIKDKKEKYLEAR